MKKFSFNLLLFFCLLFTGNLVFGQNYFRVINGIPHLPVTSSAAVGKPETGMLIYGSTENKPLIYTGSAWETLCTSNIFKITAEDYFTVKNGISYLPVLDNTPATANKPGTIYYSLANRSAMIHNGTDWVKLQSLSKTTFTESNDFSAGVEVKTFKLPVLVTDPAPLGLTKGAFYINAITKTIRYYDGTAWLDLRCMPELFTLTPTQIKGSSAVSGGDVTSNGGLNIITAGICWSANPDPTIALGTKTSQSINDEGLGVFTSALKNLMPNTKYHVRAYVINELGVFYGDDKIFETGVDLPTIITLPVTDINSTTAISGGDISDNGGSAVTSRGIRWSVKGDPLDDENAEVTDDGSGVGAFPSTMIGMMGNTTYYVRAYAVNSAGIAYGNLLQFTTLPATAPVLSLATINIRDITHQSAVGAVTILSNGGAEVTQRGLAWSTDKENWTFGISTTVNPTDIGVFIGNLTRLTPGTTYYAKGYATNSVGTTYSSETSFRTSSSIAIATVVPSGISGTTAFSGGIIAYNGGSGITARGICWSTNELPTIDLDTKIASSVPGDGTGTYNTLIPRLTPGVTYYVRAYAVNALGTAYGAQYSFTTLNIPQVTTLTANAVTANTAAGRGQVVDDGGTALTSRGTVWTTDISDIANGTMSYDGTGVGLFSGKMTGLIAGTTYYYRAYATNNVGTAYGSILQLTTLPAVKPVLTSLVLDIAATTATTATGKSTLLSNGGAPILTSGVLYSTDKITYQDGKSVLNNSTGELITNLTGLQPGTKYYAKGYVTNIAGTVYTEETSFTTPLPISIATTAATLITSNVAYSGGVIIDPGNSVITGRGICWSTTDLPTVGDNITENGSGPGTFSSKITGLTGSTRYYIRAYAYNNTGIVYGNQVTFVTAPAGLASVNTLNVTNIGGIVATGVGQVTDHGGDVVSARGFVWNTKGEPSIDDQYTEISGAVGNFSTLLKDLKPLTKYYIKAYATNGIGISYGEELTFTTATTATVITSPVSAIATLTATGGGEVISDGGTPVTMSGICWNTTGMPTTSDLRTVSGTGIGQFIHQMNGLTGSTTYYVRAYAINNAGIAYGEVQQFTSAPPTIASVTTKLSKSGENGLTGYSGGIINNNGGTAVTKTGVVWSLTPGFDPEAVAEDHRLTMNGSDTFDLTLSPLTTGTTYYVRAFAVNKVGVAYADNEERFTTFTLPTVTTAEVRAMDITHIEAFAGGNVTNDGGGARMISSGVCWSTDNNPTISNTYSGNPGVTGEFNVKVTGLLGSTTYYVRAYAINSVGIAYGEVKSFVTLPPVLATLTTAVVTDVTAVMAISGGEILTNGGAAVTTRGIIWDTNADLDLPKAGANKTAETGYFTGSFTSQLKGLTENTVYYVRAYVISKVGIAYGNVLSFRTPQRPQITTLSATSIRSSSALSGGHISDEGGSFVYSRGLMWSVSKDFNPDTVVVNRTSNGTRGGIYNSSMIGLKANTTYYMMAYASNVAGTSYGNLLSFTTDPARLPTVITIGTSGLRGTTASSGGQVTDNGGDVVTARGVVWSTEEGFSPEASTTQKRAAAVAGNGGYNVAVNPLTPGVKYYVRAYAVNSIGTAYGAEVSFTTPVPATLTTTAVAVSSSAVTAVSGGTIISNGGAILTAQGVIWSTQPNPVIGLMTKTNDQNNADSFRSTLTGLLPVTTYYVRAYATNSEGVAYGNELVFTTPPVLATLTTTLITPSSKSSATTGGNITKDGGAAITERGVVWSKDRNFNPDAELINRTSDGTGKGLFTSEMTNMDLSVFYYVRAYAVNSIGTAYGNQISVTLFPTAPLLKTTEITNVTGYSAVSGGEITSDGGADVTQKGICWSIRPNPTVTDTRTNVGAGTDSFVSSLSSLLPNTLYYVRAYAVNKIGTAYGIERTVLTNALPTLTVTTAVTNIIATTATSGGEITDDGRTPILSRGIVWNTTGNPVIGSASQTIDNVTRGTGVFVADLKGLQDNTTYYVRSYATNSVGTTYGSQVFFTTLEVMLPVLTTTPPAAIGSSFATGGGNITDDGGMPVTTRGIVWNISPSPTIALATKLNHNTNGIGNYSDVFTGLMPGTRYYVRAYATNSKGTAYGNEEVFTTLSAPPIVGNVTLTKPTMTTVDGSATISSNGGEVITERGFYWSTNNVTPDLPLAAENKIPVNSDFPAITGTVTGLKSGERYYVWAYASNAAGTGISSAAATLVTPGVPLLSATTKATSVTDTYAASGGGVIGDGGAAVTARGVIWSTDKNVTADLATKTINGAGTGGFSSAITPLVRGTKYYIRAYATNIFGTGYGTLDSLTTLDLAKLTTTPATSISNNSAVSGGEITSDGGAAITAKGVVWSKEKGPTILLATKTNNGTGSGIFVSNLTGLELATKYYFRAYATNSVGTVYGDLDSLATPAILPSLSIVKITDLLLTTATAAAEVTADGGAEVTARGFVINRTGSPVVGTDKVITVDAGMGSFTKLLENLEVGKPYFIRAYATNAVGTAYSVENSLITCVPSFTVVHKAGFNGAPVDKTVVYGTVSANLSGAAKCWITQNLGADRQGTVLTDATEASSGWYWQFGQKQGYKHDGTTRTPNDVPWVTWVTNFTNWPSEIDPCTQLLGSGWRLPTGSEWAAVVGPPQNWKLPADGFASVLKLHSGGYLHYGEGIISNRGADDGYWSSSHEVAGLAKFFTTNGPRVASKEKGYGFPVRCLMDEMSLTVPALSDVKITIAAAESTAQGIAAVAIDGGAPVTAKGLVWSTKPNPTIADHVLAGGNGIGEIKNTLTDLTEEPVYYVRAFATNSVGTGYSVGSASFRICKPVNVIHKAWLNGAAADKTVSYKTVSQAAASGSAQCWITQNLGSDQQAVSFADATEPSGGWYWQFNRLQGYKNVGTGYLPPNAWTPWITNISEVKDWTPAADPCVQLLGGGWRLPTGTEWTLVSSIPQKWKSTADAYASELKLHAAGNLLYSGGTMSGKGSLAYYWSSTSVNLSQGTIFANTSTSTGDKNAGFPVRCLRDTPQETVPTVSNVVVPVAEMTANSAAGSATVVSEGSSAVTARGLVWGTTENPTLADQVVTVDKGTGDYKGLFGNLAEGPTYYVRAFATNSGGTGYSAVSASFKICNPFTVVHKQGVNGAPADKTVTYGTVSSSVSGAPRCWITQNLGADKQATTVTEVTETAGGWYWQFNRVQGYKYETSRIPNSSYKAWQSTVVESSTWVAANDPCVQLLGGGWRLPTAQEFRNAIAPPQNWKTVADGFNSVLKLHMAGTVGGSEGALANRGAIGYYWSSTEASTSQGFALTNASAMSIITRGEAMPVRCLRDEIEKSIPTVSNVLLPTGKMTASSAEGSATVSKDGGAPVTARGLVWSTSDNPTITDHIVPAGAGLGLMNGVINGLTEESIYYVRAFATNSEGTAYSASASSFRICNPVTAIHRAWLNGAAADKTVTYKTVSSTLSGTAQCWIAQNLGADQQAASFADATEPSGGWYWQFNRLQGYKNVGTGYLPPNAWTPWITNISEVQDWTPAADPCVQLLGGGWRLPTAKEWSGIRLQPEYWLTPADGYASELKLHAAGSLLYSGGTISGKGSQNYYWSSTSVNLSQGTIFANTTTSTGDKNAGFPVRCVRDMPQQAVPAVSNVVVPIAEMTANSAAGLATVVSEGSSAVTARGLVWSTKDNPTLADQVVTVDKGTGDYKGLFGNLAEGPTYYVRAFATNSGGTGYSAVSASFKICNPFTVVHKQGVNGAPADKTVTYGTVSSSVSGAPRCWITQNLGADKQATAVTEVTETAGGWYWQFNRVQGYKYETSRIPNSSYKAWQSTVVESSTWVAANDPCVQLLGGGWRLPTAQEFRNAIAPPQNWKTVADGFNSVLKLHMAGTVGGSEGTLANRGGVGYYWSSTEASTSQGFALTNASAMSIITRGEAMPVRCLRDEIEKSIPTVSNVLLPTGKMTASSAEGSATVSKDGGAPVTARGLVWSTSDNPTITDHIVPAGAGLGLMNGVINGLTEESIYYVRAFATNSEGTAYSAVVNSFRICNPVTAIHRAWLNGAAADKTVTYKTVSSTLSGTAQCWIAQNLGADQQAASFADATEPSGGWYWQFNRLQGYKNVGTGYLPPNAWTPWITNISEVQDWTPAADPCVQLLGGGWRLPTAKEWGGIRSQPEYWLTPADGYASELKLHAAGYLVYSTGSISGKGSQNYYWSSTSVNLSQGTIFANTTTSTNDKNSAFPVRCVRDMPQQAVPAVSNVVVPVAEMTANSAAGSATVVSDGGSAVTARGLVWSTKDNPTLADQVVTVDKGTGDYKGLFNNLAEGPTYYVRAFATNGSGTGYSAVSASFKICNPFTIVHKQGVNGAPADKTVTYGTVSSSVSGAPRCWITQNLGADKQATAITDATEPSGGWYWQFNRVQGYKYETSRIPNSSYKAWQSTVVESSTWVAANDPCVQLLGGGWRLPTAQEFRNAIAPPQNWKTVADGFNSVLKLHMAGTVGGSEGTLANRGGVGYYWSSTESSTSQGSALTNASAMSIITKGEAMPVRCLRDEIEKSIPTVSNVLLPTEKMTASSAEASATVSKDGGAPVTARGLVWNTTGNPTLADGKVILGGGLGAMTGTIVNLTDEPVYYVRAFATNSEGTAYSAIVNSFRICNPVTAIHRAWLNGAAADKTVTYKTVSSTLSGTAQCWIAQNLGADQQAASFADATEPSGGWYWQFNRLQGYKNVGTGYLPPNAWTPWITNISEVQDWTPAADPCVQLLGGGWRLPTAKEWGGIRSQPEYWLTPADGYASELKLHAAGYLVYSTGSISGKGSLNYYWSSTSVNTTQGTIFANTTTSTNDKNSAFPVRCVRDMPQQAVPAVSNVVVPVAEMTANSAAGSATVVSDGGSAVTARGLVWSTKDSPTLADQVVTVDKGTGDYKGLFGNLAEGPTYYVRAFATNGSGTGYSAVSASFKICNPFTIVHKQGVNGAPADKTVTYGTVSSSVSGAPRCWITQNLGADKQATAVTDATEPSGGWYWQFNRVQGYKYETSRIPNSSYKAWQSTVVESSTWVAANDPCVQLLGGGWRLPTAQEFKNAIAPPQNWKTVADGFNSVLKLHMAGTVGGSEGTLANRGGVGYYWSSTESSTSQGSALTNASAMSIITKGEAMPVRCLRDEIEKSIPTVSNVLLPTEKMTASSAEGSATVSKDGGAPVTARGLVWNTTGNPTLADGKVISGAGLGVMTGTLTGLTEEPVYYVRAFATNSEGTAYSAIVNSFRICNPVTAIHKAGVNGAAVDKTVTYKTVSSTLTGSAQCWIAQNLGADQQAAAVNDVTEPSSGWYWQFNRLQGYKLNGNSYIPLKPWITNISEAQDWAPAADPCVQLLGGGWRLPTAKEWGGIRLQPEYWLSSADAYASELKLHLNGYLSESNGTNGGKGSLLYYWSSTSSAVNQATMFANTVTSTNGKSNALPVRCLRDAPVK